MPTMLDRQEAGLCNCHVSLHNAAAREYACHNCSEDIAKGQRYFRVYGSCGGPSAGKFCSERCAGQFALRGV